MRNANAEGTTWVPESNQKAEYGKYVIVPSWSHGNLSRLRKKNKPWVTSTEVVPEASV